MCRTLAVQFLVTALVALFAEGAFAVNDRRGVVLPIPSLQIPVGERFIGSPAGAKALKQKHVYQPEAFNMHQDSGNTGTVDYSGPLGTEINVSSALEGLHILLWTKSGQMVAGYTEIGLNGLKWGLAAVENETLAVQATWFPEVDGQTLNVAYMELVFESDQIVVTSKEGQIYVVQLSYSEGSPNLDLARIFNLDTVLAPGELLINAMYDSNRNLWFTSGGLRSQTDNGHGDPAQNSTTIGYIEPTGPFHILHIANEMVENGITVTGTTVYVITGPSGSNDHQNATGTLYSLTSGPGTSITKLWSIPYEAGDTKKPGAFARGSGATPALLGDQYVAITDNANDRVNLVVYRQTAQNSSSQTICKVPLFESGLSNVDIAPLTHGDGKDYGVMLCNNFNAPTLYYVDSSLDGEFNNLSTMAPGVVRVNVATDGSSCEIAWENDLRVQSVPILSTQNGLVYGYTQSVASSLKGIYVWYAVAFNWKTGKEVWRARAGAGGTYNDDYQPGALGPDGSFYQSVIGGLVRFKDGERTEDVKVHR